MEKMWPREEGTGGRQLGRRAATQQGGADRGLAAVEARPNLLPGSAAERTPRGPHRLGERARDGALEERPKAAGGRTQPPDFVGDPDAEGSPAAGPPITVAAKDPPGPECFSLGGAVVEPVQGAMPNQRTDLLAMGARGLFEPLGERGPILLVAVEAAFVTHVRPMPQEIL